MVAKRREAWRDRAEEAIMLAEGIKRCFAQTGSPV